MTWVKIDDAFPDHPKVLEAGDMAAWLYVSGLCYCSRHLTDGRIPRAALRKLTGLPKPEQLAHVLVDAGMWIETDGGWLVHNYAEHQRTRDQIDAGRSAARQRQSRRRHAVTPAEVTQQRHGEVTEPEEKRTEKKKINPTSSSSAEPSSSAAPTGNVGVVFEAWRRSTSRPKAQLDPKRRRTIANALKAYPLDDVLAAVEGWRHSPHHRGENDRQTVYNDLDLILRDAARIEQFRDLERNAQPLTVAPPHRDPCPDCDDRGVVLNDGDDLARPCQTCRGAA